MSQVSLGSWAAAQCLWMKTRAARTDLGSGGSTSVWTGQPGVGGAATRSVFPWNPAVNPVAARSWPGTAVWRPELLAAYSGRWVTGGWVTGRSVGRCGVTLPRSDGTGPHRPATRPQPGTRRTGTAHRPRHWTAVLAIDRVHSGRDRDGSAADPGRPDRGATAVHRAPFGRGRPLAGGRAGPAGVRGGPGRRRRGPGAGGRRATMVWTPTPGWSWSSPTWPPGWM